MPGWKTRTDPAVVNDPTYLEPRITGVEVKQTSQDQRITEVYDFKNFEVNDKGRKKKPILTFISDDANTQDYTVLKPIFDAESVPCCTSVITNNVGTTNYCSKAQLLELQSAGWEILSHTKTHAHLTALSDAGAEAEFKDSKQWLLDNGFSVQSIAYPYNDWATREKYYAKKYFRAARCSDNGKYKVNLSPIETHELKSIWIDGTAASTVDTESGFTINTLDYYKFYIDKAASMNSWLIISCHSWDIEQSALQTLLTQVIQYAKSKASVLTFADALNTVGNIVEVGDFTKITREKKHFAVGYDGNIDSNNMEVVYLGLNAVDGNTSIDAFADNKVSICKISTATASSSGMGSSGGTLLTYKVSIDKEDFIYNYQEFLDLNGVKYTRQCATNKIWGSWRKLNSADVATIQVQNSLTCATPITSFPIGVSYTTISTATASTTGSPGGLGGTLITYKFTNVNGNHGYNWQEYHQYGNISVWKRTIGDTGTFGAWTKISAV